MTDAATEDLYAHLALLPDAEQRDIIRVRPHDPLGNWDEQRVEEDDGRTSSD